MVNSRRKSTPIHSLTLVSGFGNGMLLGEEIICRVSKTRLRNTERDVIGHAHYHYHVVLRRHSLVT